MYKCYAYLSSTPFSLILLSRTNFHAVHFLVCPPELDSYCSDGQQATYIWSKLYDVDEKEKIAQTPAKCLLGFISIVFGCFGVHIYSGLRIFYSLFIVSSFATFALFFKFNFLSMKVLLTGGSGFLGAHCIESLLKHGFVSSFDNSLFVLD